MLLEMFASSLAHVHPHTLRGGKRTRNTFTPLVLIEVLIFEVSYNLITLHRDLQFFIECDKRSFC